MLALDVRTAPAWICLALHGSYGVAWVVKDVTVPDGTWQRRVSWTGVLAAWSFLSLYWIAPALLIFGTAGILDLGGWEPASTVGLSAAVALSAIGLVLMVGSDIQKNATLGLRGGQGGVGPGLIDVGFYARIRHPNYLGEMMIYGSFALVVSHWVPWAIVVGVWLLLFLPSMLAIEARLSRYPEYPAWKRRTGLLLPRLGSREPEASAGAR
ncbi:MAG: DUF1295 domain-containing protein [Gemmatimonadota bacterium]